MKNNIGLFILVQYVNYIRKILSKPFIYGALESFNSLNFYQKKQIRNRNDY